MEKPYILLLRWSEEAFEALPEPERQTIYQASARFTREVVEQGAFIAGDRLKDSWTATTVRVSRGRTLLTDGPFAETREQLGGYYMVRAANIEEACAIAARHPMARLGSVEVRGVGWRPDE